MLNILFWLFVGSMILHGYMLARFVMRLNNAKLLSPDEMEGLNQLIISGSGGVGQQWRALIYIVERKYSNLEDNSLVKSGDYARISFFFAFVLMVGWGVAAMLTN